MVTVFTSSYNHGKYLRQAIESVLNQTYQDFEYFIIDDGSNDDTLKIMSDYADTKYNVWFSSNNNRGVGYCINKAVSLSIGDYFCWLPADDYFAPDMLEKKVEYAKKFPDSVLYNNFHIIDEDGGITKHEPFNPITSDEFKTHIFKSCDIAFTGIFIPMEYLRKFPFPETRKFSEDYWWLLNAVKNDIPFDLVPDYLHFKRKHANTISAKYSQEIQDNIEKTKQEFL